MRKLLTFVLVLAMVSIGLPAGVLAQSAGNSPRATISGETTDAGGRALVSQRVELVRSGEVIATTTTGNRGEWSFANVAPGDYVVRSTFSGTVAGVRVTVVAGQMAARALIVAPSVAVASPALLGPVLSLGWVPATAIFTGVALGVGYGIKKIVEGS